MAEIRNILFIMADQLRWDYLSAYGHPGMPTPHLDRLAANGVRFNRAYAQSAICGPSRMSFYTGRYVTSHGSTWNQVPLNIGEWTLGDYLRPLGLRVALAGKTHMPADLEGMGRLGLDPESADGVLASQCGFEPYIRDDGLHPSQSVSPDLAYNRYLAVQGYDGDNPWHDWANSAEGEEGEILSGWYLRNAQFPARIRAEHSETPWMTDQALSFIREQGEAPWCLHLSYIKPHWPYMAPEPYFSMFGAEDVCPVNRAEEERSQAHPVMRAFMNHAEGRNFSKPGVREKVIPAYMALIKQLDDEIGRLMAELEEMGRLDDTLIVFTADHGDYLGDHWLGEKELFHDCSVRLPLIISGPGLAKGGVEDRLVEAIDLVPTFIDALGGEVPSHRLEGRSLLPLLKGNAPRQWRDVVISELDYSHRGARLELGRGVNDCRGWMLFDGRWKYVAFQGFEPQLFDLENDPDELEDLGRQSDHQERSRAFQARLFTWLTEGRNIRATLSDEAVEQRTDSWLKKGVVFGEW
ncbi:sulfatase-like hydrolase/transferase [Aestuariispira insulae]|uniref:Arylsulfatase A-like enzyme n=1 Tax=Aestuariispira insulae TaxID=1461337 RepID=A0A3D9HI09_9PROT|nr:sulfatase-like hydrolase/transferase [Aestuariispira insulae]RED49110.1 arylsulfatase A-like enzyme [Aestuariispira insulae]